MTRKTAEGNRKFVVRYVKSCIGYPERQKRTLRALGLKRLGDQVEVLGTAPVQGMLRKISHLVEVTDADAFHPRERQNGQAT